MMLRTFPGLIGLALGTAACFSPNSSGPELDLATDGGPGDGTDGSASSTSDGSSLSRGSDGSSATEDTSVSGATGPTGPSDPTAPSGSDGETTTSDGGFESSESGDGSACGGGELCAPAAPPMWDGPITLVDDGPCPGEVPVETTFAHTGLSVPATSCACSCGDPTGTNCGSITIGSRDVVCEEEDFTVPPVELTPGVCRPVVTSGVRAWLHDDGSSPLGTVTSGTCSPAEDFDVPPTSWAEDLRTCGSAEPPQVCEGGGRCQPALARPVCIVREGDHACPASDYTDRHLVFESVDDDRECTSCSCGTPSGDCAGSVTFTSGGCGAGALFIGSLPTDSCANITGADSAFYNLQPDAECAASGGQAQGAAVEADPHTICCL